MVVPIYNVEPYLVKCLDSIVNQSYKNLEIILVDDGSPDNCPKICDEYATKDQRIKVIHKKNGGVSSARNVGLENCTGSAIAFIDADDYLDKNFIAELVYKMESDGSDVVISKYFIEKNNQIKICEENSVQDLVATNNLKYIFNRARIKENDDNFYINNNVPCFLWRMLFKRSIIGNLKFHEDVSLMEDVLFFGEISYCQEVKYSYVDIPLYYYQLKDNSAMRAKKSIFENHKNFYQHLQNIVNNEDLLKAFKFILCADCVYREVVYDLDKETQQIADWKSKENYRLCKKYIFGMDLKIKYFLVYHGYFKILKLLYNLREKLKN